MPFETAEGVGGIVLVSKQRALHSDNGAYRLTVQGLWQGSGLGFRVGIMASTGTLPRSTIFSPNMCTQPTNG